MRPVGDGTRWARWTVCPIPPSEAYRPASCRSAMRQAVSTVYSYSHLLIPSATRALSINCSASLTLGQRMTTEVGHCHASPMHRSSREEPVPDACFPNLGPFSRPNFFFRFISVHALYCPRARRSTRHLWLIPLCVVALIGRMNGSEGLGYADPETILILQYYYLHLIVLRIRDSVRKLLHIIPRLGLSLTCV